jgi:hypothetical protein
MAEQKMAEEISAVGEGLGLISKCIGWISNRLGRRIRIREIKNNKDSDIHETLDLYEKIFKEDHRIVSSDLIGWLRETKLQRQDSAALSHCLLIAKCKGKVTAMLKAIRCPKSHIAFIAYFGVEKSDAITRRLASKMLLRFFKHHLAKRWKNCNYIIFEADTPAPRIPKLENEERKARLRLFRDIARQQGLNAYQLKIDYSQPKMADAASFNGAGRKMALVVIPTQPGVLEAMNRSDVESIVSFLFFRIYSGTQLMQKKTSGAYAKHLRKVYSGIMTPLDDWIELQG